MESIVWGWGQWYVAIIMGLALLSGLINIWNQKDTGIAVAGFILNLILVYALRAGGFW